MKLMNLTAHDAERVSRGRKGLQRGNRLEAQVWAEFGNDPQRLHALATTLRSFIDSDLPTASADSDEDDVLEPEGRLLSRVHRSYERNPTNRRRKLAQFRKTHHGRVFCECCGFDFERTYGQRGAGFIECHHQLPVSQLTPDQRVRLSDLRLLCSNCHRMVHRLPFLTTADELIAIIRELSLGNPKLQDKIRHGA